MSTLLFFLIIGSSPFWSPLCRGRVELDTFFFHELVLLNQGREVSSDELCGICPFSVIDEIIFSHEAQSKASPSNIGSYASFP